MKEGVQIYMSDKNTLLHNIVYNFIHVNHKHKKIMVKLLDSTGVYESQHRLLMHISRHNDYSQKQLADDMKISTPSVAVTLKKLENGGYIERLTDTDDNRYNKINITSKGQEVVEKSMKIFQYSDSAMFTGFDDSELETLSNYLHRISSNLDAVNDTEF